MGKHRNVLLTESDRAGLKKFSTTGVHSVRLVNRTKIILTIDKSFEQKKETNHTIANHLNVNYQTTHDTKQAYLNSKNL